MAWKYFVNYLVTIIVINCYQNDASQFETPANRNILYKLEKYYIPNDNSTYSANISVSGSKSSVSVDLHCELPNVFTSRDVLVVLQRDVNISSKEQCLNSTITPYDQGDYMDHVKRETICNGTLSKSNANGSCVQDLNVKFPDVFAGCYILWIRSNGNYARLPNNSAIFIETNKNFMGISDLQKNISYSYDEDRMDLTVDAYLDNKILKKIGYYQNVENLFVIALENDDVNYEAEEDKLIHTTLRIEKTDDITIQTILFKNVSKGCYDITYALAEEERCYTKTGNKWQRQIDISNSTYIVNQVTKEFASHKKSYAIITLSIALSSILVISLTICYYKARIRKNMYTHKPTDTAYMKKFTRNGSLSDHHNVLLVYARDCDKFMDAVKYFANLLEQYNCTVYDIFDPKYDKEISENPQNWVFKKIVDQNTKIILILNPCGIHVKKSAHPTLLYKIADWADELFSYMVNLMIRSQNVTKNNNHFIVLFDKFTDYREFKCVPVDASYELPKYFKHLVADVKNVKLHKTSPLYVSDERFKTFNEFIDKCKVFDDRCGQDLDYFKDIVTL